MEKHVTILGALYIALSSLGILAAIIVFTTIAGGGLLSGEPEAIAFGSAIAGFLALISVPGIIGGIGMLKRKSWARILVLILGFLNLLNIPFGTVVGIYTIWVLMKDETARLFASELRS
ncbi:hypothetical protein FJZ31_27010 [Candidatus Poribacteria bacterium]|nr:hypothetical protein [Candidatus Poribacteria bacterium]